MVEEEEKEEGGEEEGGEEEAGEEDLDGVRSLQAGAAPPSCSGIVAGALSLVRKRSAGRVGLQGLRFQPQSPINLNSLKAW